MNIDLFKQDLISHEGKRKHVYEDSLCIPTIGVGRNLIDVGLSDDEIDYLLENDIKRVQEELDAKLFWWRTMTEPRQRVLANMCFNLGINRLLGFKNTLTLIKEGQYEQAAKEMMRSRWATQVGKRALHLSQQLKAG